jgi:tetratricopeptide (TPR) repeat protein
MGSKKKKKKQRGQTEKPVEQTAAARPRGWRLWLFRLAAVVLAPVVFLALIEAVLRVAGYGAPASFFIEEPDSIRTNPAFSRICFPPELARMPVPERIPDPKPPTSYRIFVLGGSAAQGFPKPAYGFGRILEAMLRERYPAVEFEVVNAALTAINSHVVLPIARDCARREADLLVVYMGNNEVVGPFGPGTVFAEFSRSLPLIRASLAVKRSRAGQLIGSLMSLGRQKSAGWAGMEMFIEHHVAADDPRMSGVYEHFKRNLTDVIESAVELGIPVVVSNVAVNLKDNPPFASLHRPNMEDSEIARWQEALDAGIAFEEVGSLEDAAEMYRAALEIDDRHAELHFRLARLLLAAGDADGARLSYGRALELDALRFRADRGINEAIREVAEGRREEGVYFVDAVRAFAESEWTERGIAGEELFYDHVHMNFEGGYVLARAVFEQVAELLPIAAAAGVPSPERCGRRVAFTDWERGLMFKQLGALLDKKPFTDQLDHDVRQRSYHQRMLGLDREMSLAKLRRLTVLYESVTTEAPRDPWLRIGYAALLDRLGDRERAVEQLSAALNGNPTHSDALWQLSKILAKQGRYEEEARYLKLLLEIDPFFMQARTRRAINLQQRGRTDDSILAYRELLRDYPDNSHIHCGLARILMKSGNTEEAVTEYRRALEIEPDFAEARTDLVRLMLSRGDRTGAIAECKDWMRAATGDAGPYLLLGSVLERSGDPAGAEEQYRKAVEVDPRSMRTRMQYGDFLHRRGATAQATAFHRRMLDSDPDIAGGHYLLGLSLAREGMAAQGVVELRAELSRAPEFRSALLALARILATDPDPSVRDGTQALAVAEKLAAVAPDDPASFDALAAAYAESGHFDRAVEAEKRALQLAQAGGRRKQQRAREYAERLELYRSGRPFRAGKQLRR